MVLTCVDRDKHVVFTEVIKYSTMMLSTSVDRDTHVVFSEEIAFYQGQRREQHIIIATFNKLVSDLSVFHFIVAVTSPGTQQSCQLL